MNEPEQIPSLSMGLLSMSQARKEVTRINHNVIDSPIGELEARAEFDEDGRLINICLGGVSLNGKELHFTHISARSFLKFIGVPGAALREYGLDSGLVSGLIEYSLNKRKDQVIRFTCSNQDVLGVSRGGPAYVLLEQAFREIEKLEGVLGIQWIRVVCGLIDIRVLSDIASNPPEQVGDRSNAGVCTRLNGKVETSAYVRRLVCMNGMLGNIYRPVRRLSKGMEMGDYMEAYRNSLRSCWDEAKTLLDDFVSLSEVKVSNPTTALSRILEHGNVPRRQRAELYELLPSLPGDPTAYDVVNLVSAYGRTKEDLESRTSFERAGGVFVTEVAASTGIDSCSQCGHHLN